MMRERLTAPALTLREKVEARFMTLMFKLPPVRCFAGDFLAYVNETDAPRFFESVQFDVAYLHGQHGMARFERDENGLLRHIITSYRGRYCPNAFYPYFDETNRFQYAVLRSSIDDALDALDEQYIFNDRR